MRARQFAILLLVLVSLLFVGQPIAHDRDARVSRLVDGAHLMISDPAHQINLWPSFLWILLILSSLQGHLRRTEFPNLSFEFALLLGFASIVIYAALNPDAKQLGLWKMLNAGGFGLSLIAMGLYDHIILVRALPRRVAEEDDE
jgi:hypothetical protein